jgi:hypothetical protein
MQGLGRLIIADKQIMQDSKESHDGLGAKVRKPESALSLNPTKLVSLQLSSVPYHHPQLL